MIIKDYILLLAKMQGEECSEYNDNDSLESICEVIDCERVSDFSFILPSSEFSEVVRLSQSLSWSFYQAKLFEV